MTLSNCSSQPIKLFSYRGRSNNVELRWKTDSGNPLLSTKNAYIQVLEFKSSAPHCQYVDYGSVEINPKNSKKLSFPTGVYLAIYLDYEKSVSFLNYSSHSSVSRAIQTRLNPDVNYVIEFEERGRSNGFNIYRERNGEKKYIDYNPPPQCETAKEII